MAWGEFLPCEIPGVAMGLVKHNQQVPPTVQELQSLYAGEGENPDMVLMLWREAVPEVGTKRDALGSLALLVCVSQLPFLKSRAETKTSGRLQEMNHVATGTLL